MIRPRWPRAIAGQLALLAEMAARGEIDVATFDVARPMVLAGAPAAAAADQARSIAARATATARRTA